MFETISSTAWLVSGWLVGAGIAYMQMKYRNDRYEHNQISLKTQEYKIDECYISIAHMKKLIFDLELDVKFLSKTVQQYAVNTIANERIKTNNAAGKVVEYPIIQPVKEKKKIGRPKFNPEAK